MADQICDGETRPTEEYGDDKYEFLLVKYKLLFDHARDMILFVDQKGKILDANRAALEVYGYTHEEITDMFVFDLRKYDQRELVLEQMQKASESSILFETVHKTKDGKTLPVEVSSTGVVHNGERMLMSIIRDVSAKKAYLSRIERLAYYDELTGILNRKSFRDAIRERIAQGQGQFALMLIDIDNFKRVNDTCSHCVGDKFLVEMARAVGDVLGSRGKFYRLGGDEFTILTEAFDCRDDLVPIVNEIRAAASRRFEIDGCSIESSLSIGISLFPYDGEDEGLLLKRADIAMYRVKESTRDNFSFYG